MPAPTNQNELQMSQAQSSARVINLLNQVTKDSSGPHGEAARLQEDRAAATVPYLSLFTAGAWHHCTFRSSKFSALRPTGWQHMRANPQIEAETLHRHCSI